MDIVPVVVENQVVCNIKDPCKGPSMDCRCVHLVLCMHNWSLINQQPYILLDFQDEKHVCSVFIEEVAFLKKRLTVPLLLIGVMPKPLALFRGFNFKDERSFFMTPQDAIHSLDAQYRLPTSPKPTTVLSLGHEIMQYWSHRIEL